MSFNNVKSWFLKTKTPSFQTGSEYYNWGDSNVYPNHIKDLIINSPTAQDAWSLNSKFIAGLGFPDDVVINNITGETVNSMLSRSAEDVSFIRGFVIHVNYSLDLVPMNPVIVPVERLRVGFNDDNDNYVEVKICKDWAFRHDSNYFNRLKSWVRGDSGTNNAINTFYKYNSDKKVVAAQIRKSANIGSDIEITQEHMAMYKGQVFFPHMNHSEIYPISPLNSRRNSMDTEYNNEVSRNSKSKIGYGSKWIIIKRTDEQSIGSNLGELDNSQFTDSFQDDTQVMSDFMSKEENGTVIMMETNQPNDNLDQAIKLLEIKPNVDIKQQEYTDKKSEKNIRNGFDNIPSQLVDSENGGLFGANEGMLKQMRDFYNDQTQKPRDFLEKQYNILFKDMGLKEQKIIPIYQLKDDDTINNESGDTSGETINDPVGGTA